MQHTAKMPIASNGHKFVHTYANYLKQSELKIPDKIINKISFTKYDHKVYEKYAKILWLTS